MDLALSRRRPRREAGFSLIEMVVASSFLLVVALGLVPLFTQALIHNESGASSSDVSNIARSRLEWFNQLPFNSPPLTIETGTEKVLEQYFSAIDQRWHDGVPPTMEPVLWTATVTVRQYNNEAFEDDQLEESEALPADTPTVAVHFKQLQVEVEAAPRAASLGPVRQITLATLKAQ